jgi:UDP-glucuronate 4-epimerase
MKVLITGSSGFIGFHLANLLLKKKIEVLGIDNLNSYYDVELKKNRLNILKKNKNFIFYKFDLKNIDKLNEVVKKNKIKTIVHLAAQAGVRYSIENPKTYLKNNLEVFFNILEVSRNNKLKHLIFASTSSVYGENKNFPLKENEDTSKPLSFYAATKKSNEVMAHSYSYIFKLPCTALRFFTVYGPYGRPDMALFKFTKSIIEKKSIDVFNYGNHSRDFTYIDDIVEGIIQTIDNPTGKNLNWNSNSPDPATSAAPWAILNIGNNKPIKLMDYIYALEEALGQKAKINFLPLQPGDVQDTFASINLLKKRLNYNPKTSVKKGVNKFVEWYKSYYR